MTADGIVGAAVEQHDLVAVERQGDGHDAVAGGADNAGDVRVVEKGDVEVRRVLGAGLEP